MKVADILRRVAGNADSAAQSLIRVDQKLDALVAGCANQSDLLNRKFDQVIAGLDNQSDLLNRKLNRLIEDGFGRKKGLGEKAAAVTDSPSAATGASTFREAMQQIPLLLAERTYNTSHPDYDARLVRNFPGRIFNYDQPCENVAFRALSRSSSGDQVMDHAWDAVLAEALVEAASVPHAEQVFERRSFVERYMAELGRKYRAHYVPGWVNLDDALFLYWLVRQVKPRTIVQTGVCNGLSAAFMMLGLVKNGPEGTLHVIDLPPVFNPDDPVWTAEGKVYGVVIPEGRTSGWLVPDAYRTRFEVWNGDAKELLPKMVDKVESIDFFYHDSDHSYNHMMFEFQQAKRKLSKGGLVVGDDVSWNASVWDFADEFDVPSYNFKGAVGVAFF
jgi:predicted O-methyltransferase YrrM